MHQLLKFIPVLLVLFACSADVEPPTTAVAIDAENFGLVEDQLFWNFEQKVAGFRNMDKISWTRAVPAGGSPYLLPRNETDLGSTNFRFCLLYTSDAADEESCIARSGSVYIPYT